MTVRYFAIALLSLVAATASAQRGGGGRGGAPPRGEVSAGENALSKLSTKDIQKFDPVKVILDKKKDLKLEDQQKNDLTKLEDEVQWNIKRLAARIDSTQKALQPKQALGAADEGAASSGGGRGRIGRGGGGSSDEPPEPPEVRRQRILDGRKVISDAIVDLQLEHDSSTALAMRVLNDAQRPAAAALLKKHDEDLQKMLKDAGFVVAPAGDAKQ